MAFKTVTNPTYYWPVVYHRPIDGRTEKITFDALFKRVSQTKIDDWIKAWKEERLPDGEVLDEVLAGWRKVEDDDGELSYSESMRDQLIDENPNLRTAIVMAFLESVKGAAAKN